MARRQNNPGEEASFRLHPPPPSLPPAFTVQVHPTSLVDPKDPTNLSKFLAPEAMRGSGGILVDAHGKRFADELTTRSVLTSAIFKAGAPMAGVEVDGEVQGVAPIVSYLLLNQEAADAFGTGVLGFYMSECGMYVVQGVVKISKVCYHRCLRNTR